MFTKFPLVPSKSTRAETAPPGFSFFWEARDNEVQKTTSGFSFRENQNLASVRLVPEHLFDFRSERQ